MENKVLIVDDEKEFVEILKERLAIRDYQVEAAYEGKTAIEKIKKENYDVVILDVQMPGVNGIDVLREIKTLKPYYRGYYVNWTCDCRNSY